MSWRSTASRDDLDDYDPERAELAAEARLKRRYTAALAAHPHPQDPDHPEPPDADHEQET
jgi:hypothetical protein